MTELVFTEPAEHSYVADDLLGWIGIGMTSFDNYNIFYYYDSEKEKYI